MVTVVPFRAGGKSRLPADVRRELALAMLADVVSAARALGEVRVVTGDVGASDAARQLGAVVAPDPGGGQGAAVADGLRGASGRCLVVNADVPCVTAAALRRLAAATPACVPAPDGTTNALALRSAGDFADLYGPGSAARFAAAGFAPLAIPELERDVDTLADLDALTRDRDPRRLGPRTALVVNHHKRRLAAAS